MDATSFSRSRHFLALSGLCFGFSVFAQPASSPAAAGDHTFVQKAAEGGAAEVALGQLAQQKASSAQVKEFGAHMVRDHSKSNDELKQIAAGKGIAPPDKPNAQQQKDAAKLEKLSAGSFDRAYMDQMVVDHKKTIALFEGEAKSGKDPELKAFAAKTLPTLTDHLKMAEQTRSASRGTGGAAATASR